MSSGPTCQHRRQGEAVRIWGRPIDGRMTSQVSELGERLGVSFAANIHELAMRRLEVQGPVRVGLIGAGKFGSMFLSQVPTSPAIRVVAIADLAPERARAACRHVGWRDDAIAAVDFLESGLELAARDDVEVVVEATGVPSAGLTHARAAIAHARHVVMVNVEADCLAGPMLAREARARRVVYSMAYGDQPALVIELVSWARACGFHVIAAGKGTKYLPGYEDSTPETVWQHYGLDPEEAEAAGMNPQMFNSFLDGTKSAIEMAAIANATGLAVPEGGLSFVPCGSGQLAERLKPASEGGILEAPGVVEVVSSHDVEGRELADHLRWGVFVVFEAPNNYTRACFRQYGLVTDQSGRYSALVRPYHLIGLELNISILSAALRGEATGTSERFVADVVAVAKADIGAGEMLDGEGGYKVRGRLMPARESLAIGALPIGLASGVMTTRAIAKGEVIGWGDVMIDETQEPVRLRRAMEAMAHEAEAQETTAEESRSREGA